MKKLAILLLLWPLLLNAQSKTGIDAKQQAVFLAYDSQIKNAPNNVQYDLLKNIIAHYPDSESSWTAFKQFTDRNIGSVNQNLDSLVPQIAGLYNLLSDRLKDGEAGKTYLSKLQDLRNLIKGGNLPTFTAPDSSGHQIVLSDFRGKYVFIDFWASWCLPCRKEFPYLKKAYEQFKNRNFEIIGYSIDNNKVAWEKAIADESISWINVSSLAGRFDDVLKRYKITGVPANFLISPEGKIIARDLRGDELENYLTRLIK